MKFLPDAALAGARHRSEPVNAAWLGGPHRQLASRFAGLTDPGAICDAVETLFADPEWAARVLDPLIAALRDDPWFEPPFKASRDPLRTGAVLLDCEAVSIAATVTSARALAALPLPETVILSGRMTVTCYLRGGNATLRRWQAPPADAQFSAIEAPPARERAPVTLADGMIVRQDGRIRGHLMVAADSDVVALTATLKHGAAPLMREYALVDSRFVRAASGDDAASRIEMLLTFLRIAGRADAAELFDAASRHPAFHLRWAAVREWLMLDARACRPRLGEMAAMDPNAEIRAAAAATLPVLDRKMMPRCPS